MVRNSNDKTMDNRAAYFRDWLKSANGYHYLCCAKRITQAQGILLIASFIDHLAITPYNKAGALRRSCTLSKFVTAAALFFDQILEEAFATHTYVGGKLVMDKKLAERIAFYKKWDTVKEKREPYTRDMFVTFYEQVVKREQMDPKHEFLGLHSLVFDTQILGIFTGSRVSEYAQGSRKQISRVPQRPGTTGPPALPIAFVAADFTFLSAQGHIIPHVDVFANPDRPVQVNVLFRYDKSGRNFVVRKFGRGEAWFCPIAAARRILLRAHMLELSATDPICAYKPRNEEQYKWLLTSEVTATMRKICVDTYTDEEHYLRQAIMNFSSHSNRVTAAVALSQSGMSIDEIAQRLRWKPASVAYYLRESAKDIGFFTANTIAGAQRPFVPDP
jgi:hypothetical protein